MNDPAAWMLECHERIRRFTGGLVRVVELGDLSDPKVPPAAAQAARYLREGLPRHAEDEDTSIAPRLRQSAPQLAVLLARQADEHAEADAHLAVLLPLLDAVAEGMAVDVGLLAAEVAWLAAHMAEHLAVEEAEIVPAVRALPATIQAQILVEMRARRGR